MSERRRVVTSVAFATLGLAIALGTGPVSNDRIVSAYVLVLAAIALAAATRVLRGRHELPPPSEFDHALRSLVVVPVRPAELVRVERELTLGTANASNMQTRLAPILREIAAARGVDVVRRPDAAREALGARTFELLRADAPPAEQSSAGPSLEQIAAVVETLERL
jgi:hypothetical protein